MGPRACVRQRSAASDLHALMHRHAISVHASRHQTLTSLQYLGRILFDADDLQIRPPNQFQRQLGIATAQVYADAGGNSRFTQNLRGGLRQ
jgi:hypothetical protein